ncbi:hypothetical protein [Legionella tunisiensis]|uniref:hypothetical protein n=1 Tax=Legionella tunisiensis TaxID=1034944 RepID=UPI0002FC8050|nr:hypothetical protein [Legionella tunisiensis]
MSIESIVFIENPSEEDHGAIYHGINHYAAQQGMASTGGYFLQPMITITKL